MNRVRFAQRERSDLNLELVAVWGDQLVGSVHGAERCLQGAARRVFERLPRLEGWLLTHDTEATDFFEVAVGVRDDPVAADQLNRVRPFVGYLDRVQEEP